MPLTKPQIEERLARIESQVPKLLEDLNGFPRAFEDEVDILLGELSTEDQGYALERLAAIVARSGFNE